jgi:hypothetical protein
MHNLNLYLTKSHLFDEVVREMTRLYSKMYFTGLIGTESESNGVISVITYYLRSDNFPLYVGADGIGKIGIIDAENAVFQPNAAALVDLARAFPLHQAIIKEEALKLRLNIEHLEGEIARSQGKFIGHVVPSGMDIISIPPKLKQKTDGPVTNEIPEEVRAGTIAWIKKNMLWQWQGAIDIEFCKLFPCLDSIPEDIKKCLDCHELAEKAAPRFYSMVADKFFALLARQQKARDPFFELQRKKGVEVDPDSYITLSRLLIFEREEFMRELNEWMKGDPLLKEMCSYMTLDKLAEGVIFDLREKVISDYTLYIDTAVYFVVAY